MNGRTRRAPTAAVALVALASLAGCGQDNPAATNEQPRVAQKQSADATGSKTAKAGQREQFLPLLRKYHDKSAWPPDYDLSPEEMWRDIAPKAGEVVLDDTAAAGHVAIVNQCAWSLAAIDAVKAGKDTAAVRSGLVRSSRLVPGLEEMTTTMVQQIELGNLEMTQQFVTANQCSDGFD